MTEVDAALVRRKLATIIRNLEDLASVEQLSLDEYRSDRFRLKGTERMLQEAIESAVDINLHVLRIEGRPAPSDYHDSFVGMGDARIIDRELATRLAPAAGLRNRLVHEYDSIDDAIVLKSVGDSRLDLLAYARAVATYAEGATE